MFDIDRYQLPQLVAQNSPDAATAYITNELLTAGNWQQYNHSKVRASVNLNYDLGDRQLNLSIDAATIQFSTPLLFSLEHLATILPQNQEIE